MDNKTNIHTRITIERERHTTIRLRRADGTTFQHFCPSCAGDVEMISPEQAAALTNISIREVYRVIEKGGVYFVEVEGGSLHLCHRCLMRNG